MGKHTQIIRRLLPTNYLSVFGHFVGLALKGLKNVTFLFTVVNIFFFSVILYCCLLQDDRALIDA